MGQHKKNMINSLRNNLSIFNIIAEKCWLNKFRDFFSVQWCCRSPNLGPSMLSVVWWGMVANHGVLRNIQQAMKYIAKTRAKNPKEDKNLITDIKKKQ